MIFREYLSRGDDDDALRTAADVDQSKLQSEIYEWVMGPSSWFAASTPSRELQE